MGTRKYTWQEDQVIRQYAGKKTAEEIGQMLGRPRKGVQHRIAKLGLKGHIHGEHHWNAKVDGLRMAMVHTLLDAGFQPAEIHRMFSEPLDLTHNYLTQIACGRYRRTT